MARGRRGTYPYTEAGVEIRRILVKLRHVAMENRECKYFKVLFEAHGSVPTTGRLATMRFAPGAGFVSQLALLRHHERDPGTNHELKTFLRAFSNYDWASARDDPYPYRRLALTGQPNLLCRYQREIEVAAGHVGTPVCDGDPHGLSSVTHLQLRTEWQASVGRRVVVCVEGMPVRHRTALERAPVVGGHHLLADTILAGNGVEVGVMYCGDTVDSLVTAVIVRDRTGGCQ